jgi:signal transduction histidine kinase
MLRPDAETARTAPPPGIGGLPVLIGQYRSAGADATYTLDGDPAVLPATTGLALYRILQESLTNAIKHAPGASTAAHLSVGTSEVVLTVDTAARPGTGTGFGLLNMRERAEAVGGTCAAGPGGRGWLVRAALPVDPARRGEDGR